MPHVRRFEEWLFIDFPGGEASRKMTLTAGFSMLVPILGCVHRENSADDQIDV